GDDFASEIDALFADTRGGSKPRATDTGTAAAGDQVDNDARGSGDFPAIFDRLDSAAADIPEATDRTFKPAPLPSRAAPAEGAPAAPAAEPLLPPEWALEPLDENSEVKPLAGKAAAFGIETMTASDFLEPEDAEPAPPPPISSGLALELVPMEEA